ncbi:MAG: hypothetical protein M3235_17150 [Actinomycetota bacterium]|nr:hypothetical protein [Actinomycetota bacterium]
MVTCPTIPRARGLAPSRGNALDEPCTGPVDLDTAADMEDLLDLVGDDV